MLYLLNLQFKKPEQQSKKSDFYYSILWAVLNLFENQEKVYESITKLSFSTNEYLNIQLTVNGEENYSYIVNYLLKHPNQEISINKQKFQLQQLKFNFEIFNPAAIKSPLLPFTKEGKKFTLYFNSPTFIRQKNISYLLPNPDQFLFSLWQKVKPFVIENEIANETKQSQMGMDTIDDDSFKKRLKTHIHTWGFDLASRLIIIKKVKKAGVVGFCTYYLHEINDEIYFRLLSLLLHSIKFFGIGSGTKLGCGNVSCFIEKQKEG